MLKIKERKVTCRVPKQSNISKAIAKSRFCRCAKIAKILCLSGIISMPPGQRFGLRHRLMMPPKPEHLAIVTKDHPSRAVIGVDLVVLR